MALKKVKKYTAEDVRMARKGGFKGKRPKKPKTSSLKTEVQYNAYVDRVNAWVDKVMAAKKKCIEKEKIKVAVAKNL